MLEKIEVWKCKCDNKGCGHEWVSALEHPPTHCPKKGCPNPTKWNSGGTKQKRGKKPIKAESKPFVDDSIVYDTDFGA